MIYEHKYYLHNFQLNLIAFEFPVFDLDSANCYKIASRADQRLLRWFVHVERMDEYRMDRRVLMAEVSGGRVRGKAGWIVSRWPWATEE